VTRTRWIAALTVSVACVGVAAGAGLTRSGGHADVAITSGLPVEHGRLAAKFEPPDGTVYLGVSTDFDRIGTFDEAAGIATHPAIYDRYTYPDGPVSPTLSDAAAIPGTTPMVSWNLPFADGAVASGGLDAYLRAQADAVKAYGKPVFIRPDWEMNASWYPQWNAPDVPPTAYIAAWRHVFDVFQSDGAANAAFVWCVNTWPGPGGTDASAWYPGDEYVDWVGVDGYPQSAPTGYLMNGPDGLNALASFATDHGKPLMLAEWAPQLPQPDTAAAVDLVLDWAAAHPTAVKALVYFDFTNSDKDFKLAEHPAGAAELRRRTQADPKYLDTVAGAG
jgi:hypothetical protein